MDLWHSLNSLSIIWDIQLFSCHICLHGHCLYVGMEQIVRSCQGSKNINSASVLILLALGKIPRLPVSCFSLCFWEEATYPFLWGFVQLVPNNMAFKPAYLCILRLLYVSVCFRNKLPVFLQFSRAYVV